MKLKRLLIPKALLLLVLLGSCAKDPVPKPRGYFRIQLPEKAYDSLTVDCPIAGEISHASRGLMRQSRNPGDCWFNIIYPQFKAQIHCTYSPIRGELSTLLRDADEFAMTHEGKATSIQRKQFSNSETDMHGLIYDIKGQVASPIQFFLTDSTTHFIRGALYFSNTPNADSVAPVQAYIREDIIHLMETARWK